MPTRRKPSILQRNLRLSVADGAAFSLGVGLGESYLPAFVLAVGLGEVVAGLVATVPLLVGALVQLITPHAVRWLGSHRRWIVLCAALQSLSYVPLFIAAAVGKVPAFLVLLIAGLYWASGMAGGPAWNTWMGRLVPRAVRPRYFAGRTRITQVTVVIGLFVGGALLQECSSRGAALSGFMILFAAAGSLRLLSTGFLALQSESPPPRVPERILKPGELLGRLRKTGGGLLQYMFCVQIFAQFAGPFFTPFMLKQLEFSYAQYVLLLGTSYVTKIIALPAFGRIAKHSGPRRLLLIGGAGIVPLAALWTLSQSFAFLFAVQILAGFCWGAYELATFLLLFETIPDSERTSVLSAFNLTNAIAQVTGSVAGGLLLRFGGSVYSTYLLIFGISTVGRLLTLPLLRRVAEAPPVPVEIGIRTLSVRPSAGSLDGPILPSIPAPEDARQHVPETDVPLRTFSGGK